MPSWTAHIAKSDGHQYLEFPGNDLIILLEDVLLQIRLQMRFLQDGTSSHFHVEIRDLFDQI